MYVCASLSAATVPAAGMGAEDGGDRLLQACVRGDVAAVAALLRKGVAADAVCGHDPETTPLLEAVKNATTGDAAAGTDAGTDEHTAIVNLLLEASADPDRVPTADPDGEPPGDSPLQHAAAEGLLVRARPLPAARCRCCTLSSADGSPSSSCAVQDIVHLLLRAKADVNACASLPDDDDAFYDQPPLSFSCENAHPDVVAALLANGADVNRRSTENRSPLELAAGSENAADDALVEVVSKLVAAGASLESVDQEETPLIRAATAGHVLVTRELLEAGSGPDWSRASNGETALYVACSEGHAAVVEELAGRGGDVDAKKTTTSETALYIACSKGHLDVVKALLKADVQTDDEQNTVPRTGYYPLYIAASNGHAEVVDELYQSGCSIATLTTNKDTPLIIAAYNGYAKVIEVLAAADADVHYTKSGSGETALYYACLQGRLAAVKALIASNARHSDALFDNQETPLHCAAMGGHAQVVIELLKAGAKHDATKSDGATPLYSACHGGKLEAHDGQLQSVKELLRSGGDPNACRPMDQGGDSCLIIAAFHQRSRMVEELLKSGADVEYANTDGMCALGWAVKKNVTPMVRALIEHGADPEFYNTTATSTPLIKAAMTTVTEGETKAQQQAQEIVSILLDAGASLSQSVAVARKHVPKAVKALQVVKMRRRRDTKTKGEMQSASRTAEQLEEAELKAQQAMQELLAEEDVAQTKASKKGKRKQAHAQQSGSSKKKMEKGVKLKGKADAQSKSSANDETAEGQCEVPIPKEWAGILEDAFSGVVAELSLLGTAVSAATEVGVDSALSTAATGTGTEKSTMTSGGEHQHQHQHQHHIDNYIFFCTDTTEEECLRRGLLGDSEDMLTCVSTISMRTRLYLFNSSCNKLYGAFSSAGQPGRNMVPEAWAARGKQSGKQSQFPAQVRFTQKQPMLSRNGVHVPRRHQPVSSGPVDDTSMQLILVAATTAAGRIYPAPSTTRESTTQSVELPTLVLPVVEVFRRRALTSTVQAMVTLFDAICPERWQRMKSLTKRKFCQDLQHKWIYRSAAWNNIPLKSSDLGFGAFSNAAADALLPSAAATVNGTLKAYILQQLKAEPYHMAEKHAEGALITLVELFVRTARRVAEFSDSCAQRLQRSPRGNASNGGQQRRGRARNAVWTDAIVGVTLLSEERTSNLTRSAANTRSTIRLQWSDTQFPEMGHETVDIWHDQFQRLVDSHKANGLEPELAKARIFSMAFRHETLAEQNVGVPLALPPAAADAMYTKMLCTHECFASPWNTHTACESFCSLFADTDVFFGSRGNFFDFQPASGSFIVHSPPDLQTMQDASKHIVLVLTKSEEALSFCLVMPADLLVPITDLLEPEHAMLVRSCTVLPRGKHCFMAGMQHRQVGKSDELTRTLMVNGDSHLYWLQNQAGATEYPVTAEATAVLVDSFRPQPSGVALCVAPGAAASPSPAEEGAHRPDTAGTPTADGGLAQRDSSAGKARGGGAGSTAPGYIAASAASGELPEEFSAADVAAAATLQTSAEAAEGEPGGMAAATAQIPLAPQTGTVDHYSLEDMMEHIGGRALTIGDAAGDGVLGGDFVPDRQLLAWLDALGLAKYSPCVKIQPVCCAYQLC